MVVDGKSCQLDVVATGNGGTRLPSERTVLAIGEVTAGEAVGERRLRRLERARAALGTRAVGARLLLLARAFTPDLLAEAAKRLDVELIDLERLYHGT